MGPDHGIRIIKCDTKDLLADIFTKGLYAETFEVQCEETHGLDYSPRGSVTGQAYRWNIVLSPYLPV